MRFHDLRALLGSLGLDPLSVTFARDDPRQVRARAPLGHWVIWEHHGRFDVGSEERGRFLTTATFDSEEEACGYLAEVVTRRPTRETPAERSHSEAVTAEVDRDLRRRFTQPDEP